MRTKQFRFWILAALLLAFSVQAFAEGYRLLLIGRGNFEGPPPEFDVNNWGEVVAVTDSAAFRWRNGKSVPYSDSRFVGSAINDWSTIAGTRYADSGREGLLMHHGRLQRLEVNGLAARPFDINNRGQVLARYQNDNLGIETFLLDWRGATRLGEVSSDYTPIYAVGINDYGVVAGNVYPAVTLDGAHAVVWRNGRATMLEAPVDPDSIETCRANSINNRSQIVGFLLAEPGGKGFIWENGQMTLLSSIDQLPYGSSEAKDINDWGGIVGVSTVLSSEGYAEGTATMWIGKQPFNINELIDDEDPNKGFVTLGSARHINNRGDIIALGVDSRMPDVASYYFVTLFGGRGRH